MKGPTLTLKWTPQIVHLPVPPHLNGQVPVRVFESEVLGIPVAVMVAAIGVPSDVPDEVHELLKRFLVARPDLDAAQPFAAHPGAANGKASHGKPNGSPPPSGGDARP